MWIFIFWIIFTGLVAAAADARGRSGAAWFCVAFFLSPLIAVVLLLIFPNLKHEHSGVRDGRSHGAGGCLPWESSSSRQGTRRREAALGLSARRMAGAAVQFAQRLQDGIDAHRRLQSFGARSVGHEAIAEASEAQDARIARFSASVREGCATALGK
jgi:hypothetical protein